MASKKMIEQIHVRALILENLRNFCNKRNPLVSQQEMESSASKRLAIKCLLT